MRAVIIYESMYGNTRQIAEAIASGFAPDDQVRIVPVVDIDPEAEDVTHGADLIIVGAPTHAHSLSRSSTRKAAADAAHKDGADLQLEPGADGPGLRDWFGMVDGLDLPAAAFDTRLDAPPIFTGRASVRIDRLLGHRGAHRVAEPQSFLVTKTNRLCLGECDRAREWGQHLADTVRRLPAGTAGKSH